MRDVIFSVWENGLYISEVDCTVTKMMRMDRVNDVIVESKDKYVNMGIIGTSVLCGKMYNDCES